MDNYCSSNIIQKFIKLWNDILKTILKLMCLTVLFYGNAYEFLTEKNRTIRNIYKNEWTFIERTTYFKFIEHSFGRNLSFFGTCFVELVLSVKKHVFHSKK